MDDAIPFKRVRIRPDDPQPDDEGPGGPEGSDRSGGPEATAGAGTAYSPGKIKARIKKLLDTCLHSRTPAAEARNAWERARVLVAKHRLTFEEVCAGDVEPDRPTPNLWPAPVNGKALIGDLSDLLRRHIVMTEEQAIAVALWIAHSHAHDAARRSAILVITAPTHGCGKSQLLECLEYLVPRPWATDNATPAAIFQEADRCSTLLIDEADAFMVDPRQTELRGIINSTWKRGRYVSRANGRRFSTWTPVAIALNGHLHPFTESRAIIIKLARKSKDETVARLKEPRQDDENDPFNVIRRKLARWAADHLDALREANPEMPAELSNRDADNWRSLLAIADLAHYPKTARKAALSITGQRLREASLGEQLLADLKPLFARHGSPLASTQICDELNDMEARPWATSQRGAPLMPVHLAALLKPFGIVPSEVRTVTGKRAQGYRVQQFTDAFARYVK